MGSKPKAPKAPPDPAIAIERARRESLAMGLADARRTSRYGTNSTIVSQVGGPPAVRPDSDIETVDVFSKGDAQKAEQEAYDKKDDTGMMENILHAAVQSNDKIIKYTPAQKATRKAQKKANAVSSYINRTRARTGVNRSVGVTS